MCPLGAVVDVAVVSKDRPVNLQRSGEQTEGSPRPRAGEKPPPGGAVGGCPAVPPGGIGTGGDSGFLAGDLGVFVDALAGVVLRAAEVVARRAAGGPADDRAFGLVIGNGRADRGARGRAGQRSDAPRKQAGHMTAPRNDHQPLKSTLAQTEPSTHDSTSARAFCDRRDKDRKDNLLDARSRTGPAALTSPAALVSLAEWTSRPA